MKTLTKTHKGKKVQRALNDWLKISSNLEIRELAEWLANEASIIPGQEGEKCPLCGGTKT